MIQKILSTKVSDKQLNIALLILRATVGVLMAHHGYGKITHFNEYSEKFMDFLYLGPKISLALVIFAEFFCSLLLIAGLFTRFAIIPLVIAMGIAAFKAHGGDVFGDGEMAFLYFAIYVALWLKGAGEYSADKYLFNKD